MVNDLVADMLTRIRNANKIKAETTEVLFSKENQRIAEILVEEGYISSIKVEGDVKKKIIVTLKYGKDGTPVLNGLKRISKPGLRVYASVDELPRVLNGLGIAIVSTSKGVLTDRAS